MNLIKMRGGGGGGGLSSRFRGKELPLLLIVILGTLVLIWVWDRTPLLATTTLLPPTQEFHLSQESVLPNFPQIKDVDLTDQSSASGYTQRNPPQEEETLPAVDDKKEKEDRGEEFGDNVSKDNSTMTETEGGHYENVEENIQNGKEQVAKMIATESSTNTSSLDTKTETKDSQVVESTEITGAGNSTLSGLEEKHDESVVEKDLKQKDVSPDVTVTSSTNSSSLSGESDDNNSTVLVPNQACNYAKGKWVVDDSRSLYSGFDCKQWLAPMWACRLMKRTDFSYEKLRWQPTNCQMEAFEGAKFLKRMQGKTLAFVGDSLGRQQFQSLMCMITSGKESPDVLDVGTEYGLVQPHGGVRPNGWAYRFPSTNTTVLYYWSACLCDLEPIDVKNPSTDYAMHLDRPPSFLRRYLRKIDVLVLNTGHHWNRGKLKANRWVMHLGGKTNTDKKLRMIGDAKNFTIHSIIDWVNNQLPKNPHLKAFYRSISPRHFANGDWNTGGSCDNTTPMSIGKEVLQEESSDYSAGHAAKGTGVKLLDITALSQLREEGHISKYSITASAGVQDCLHWCLPGVPDTWNEILFALINNTAQVQSQ